MLAGEHAQGRRGIGVPRPGIDQREPGPARDAGAFEVGTHSAPDDP
jgi:hypothetical protein